MENLVAAANVEAFWRGRRVFITGSTGFKGSWLALWLARRGAIVAGYALPAAQPDDLFNSARVQDTCPTTLADIRDVARLTSSLQDFGPQVVFHLAAQPLVRRGYANPVETFSTNVLGTCNLLDAARRVADIEAVVVIATDKCYRNREWDWGYRETDELGGSDPYSASKAAAEIVVDCFRRSFYTAANIGLASARAGNVIGGGDFASDRLIPDIVRAYQTDTEVVLRHPYATRPWQHVLDCLAGYMRLAQAVTCDRNSYARAFNFGPNTACETSVLRIVDALHRTLPVRHRIETTPRPHEASRLALDTSLARYKLGWRQKLTLPTTIDWTGHWYSRYLNGENAHALAIDQIDQYEKLEYR